MSLLPGQILPPSTPLGRLNEDGTLLIDTNWWLLLYNLCNQVLGSQGGLPASALESIEITDLDTATADIPALTRQIANLNQLLPEQEVVPAIRDITNALMIALTQFEENLPFNGYATPTAKVGLTAVAGNEATAMRSDASPPLDQSIAPTWTSKHTFSPASGNAITINGLATQLGVILNTAPFYVSNNGLPAYTINSSGTNYSMLQNDSADNWSIASGTSQTVLGTSIIKWNKAGNVSIPAPTSGDALAVANVAGANALVVNGNSAGTAVIRANTQATTGAQTATFTATNKPGAANGSPQKWWPINADGTTYYIPLFS